MKWEHIECGWFSQIYRDFLYKRKKVTFSLDDLGKIYQPKSRYSKMVSWMLKKQFLPLVSKDFDLE